MHGVAAQRWLLGTFTKGTCTCPSGGSRAQLHVHTLGNIKYFTRFPALTMRLGYPKYLRQVPKVRQSITYLGNCSSFISDISVPVSFRDGVFRKTCPKFYSRHICIRDPRRDCIVNLRIESTLVQTRESGYVYVIAQVSPGEDVIT